MKHEQRGDQDVEAHDRQPHAQAGHGHHAALEQLLVGRGADHHREVQAEYGKAQVRAFRIVGGCIRGTAKPVDCHGV
jgi:hypothetical protein